MVGFVLLSLGLGGLAGLGWEGLVDLPLYAVNNDGGASTSERGLTEVVGGDAWFTVIGLVLGAVIGWLAWRLFRSVGRSVVPVAVLAAALAGLVCWAVGYQLGPGPFAPRLAAAQAGDLVPVELTLRAKASLIVWPFAATIPLLLASSLGRDDADVGPAPRAVD